jgi:hypothetical protein
MTNVNAPTFKIVDTDFPITLYQYVTNAKTRNDHANQKTGLNSNES